MHAKDSGQVSHYLPFNPRATGKGVAQPASNKHSAVDRLHKAEIVVLSEPEHIRGSDSASYFCVYVYVFGCVFVCVCVCVCREGVFNL